MNNKTSLNLKPSGLQIILCLLYYLSMLIGIVCLGVVMGFAISCLSLLP